MPLRVGPAFTQVGPARHVGRFRAIVSGPIAFVVPLAAVVLLGLADSGCNKSPLARPVARGSNASASNRQGTGAMSAAAQRCQTLLSSGIEMLRPEKLGISAEPKSAVDTLNNWVRDCGKTVLAEESTTKDTGPNDPLLEKLVPESSRAAASGDLYDLQDIEHVRNCWMFKQARMSALRQYDSDAARAVALFDLTNRLVALAGKGEPNVPQSLYEIALIGQGTAEDRAWVFAELLRQAGIDAVILKPGPAAGKAGDTSTSEAASNGPSAPKEASRSLVGALIDKQVYLFDPILGCPIPSKADKGTTPEITSAATLAQVLADDGLFRKLDVSPEKRYPLHSSDLKSLRVEAITSSRYWSPRMRRLETYLSGERSATIYAPLHDVGSRPGLLSRVIAAGAGLWNKENVAVWDYPDRQAAAINQFNPRASEVRGFRMLPFQGPVSADFDKETMQLKITPGNRKQMKSRIAQLEGDCAGAVRNYLLVQLDELPPVMPLPPEMQEAMRAKQAKPQEGTMAAPVPKMAFVTNYRAAEDAKFWMGVCQLEQNMLEPATETLDAYFRRYSQGGKWLPQAALLRGVALAKMGKYALAVQQINELLRGLPEDDPRWTACALFATRWRAARDAANAPDANSHAENSPNADQTPPKPEPQVSPKSVAKTVPAAVMSAAAKPTPASSPAAAGPAGTKEPPPPKLPSPPAK